MSTLIYRVNKLRTWFADSEETAEIGMEPVRTLHSHVLDRTIHDRFNNLYYVKCSSNSRKMRFRLRQMCRKKKQEFLFNPRDKWKFSKINSRYKRLEVEVDVSLSNSYIYWYRSLCFPAQLGSFHIVFADEIWGIYYEDFRFVRLIS